MESERERPHAIRKNSNTKELNEAAGIFARNPKVCATFMPQITSITGRVNENQSKVDQEQPNTNPQPGYPGRSASPKPITRVAKVTVSTSHIFDTAEDNPFGKWGGRNKFARGLKTWQGH